MKTMFWLSCALVASLGVASCNKKEEKSAQPAATETAAQAPPTQAAPTPATVATTVDVNSIPAEEQFEEEAEKAVTAQNVDQQVDAIEKEIQAE